MTLNRIFTAGAVVLVFAGLALAFGFLGTPAHQRLVSLDEQRLDDLDRISSSLHDEYESANLPARLPPTITAVDPVTKRSYEYHRMSATQYRLCAVFSTRLTAQTDSADRPWRRRSSPHDAGRTCYTFDVTAQR